jgi:transposase-like protein
MLEASASSRTAPHVEVVRVRIVLLAADEVRNIDIAERVGVCVDVVSRWRKRFSQQGLIGLKDRPYLPTGTTVGTAEEALDCACGLYLNPLVWLPDTPTN